jgi:hypothetical protein
VIFIKEPEVKLITKEQQRNKQLITELFSCYHVQEETPYKDYLRDIHIKEVEGERELEGPPIESKVIIAPIKVNKVNIRTIEIPKIAIIGDYWDEKTIEIITKLLREYNEMFTTTFTEMKGIEGELGEMKIPLRD